LIGFLGAIFYLANPLFIFCADNLHQLAYSGFLRSLILFTFLRFIDSTDKKRILLILLWVFIQLEFWIGLDCVIYLFLFFALYRYFFKLPKDSLQRRAIFILFSAPVVGSLIHFFQNVWYFGSLKLAFNDLAKVAMERMANSKDTSLALTFPNWWQYVMVRYFSLVLLFNYFIISVAIFFSWLAYTKLSSSSREKIKLLLRLCILLTICGISWYVVFPSHAVAHTFVTFLARHLLPVAALCFTTFSYCLFCYLKENTPFRFLQRLFLAVVVFFILFTSIVKSELPVTAQTIQRAKGFLVFKQCLIKLRQMSKEKDRVGVNYFRFPFMRYYADRQCIPIFDQHSLQALPVLPKYFIFIPYNYQSSQELFLFLKEKYDPLFECNSSVFPSVFLELKK
jgi:hypothetical protein